MSWSFKAGVCFKFHSWEHCVNCLWPFESIIMFTDTHISGFFHCRLFIPLLATSCEMVEEIMSSWVTESPELWQEKAHPSLPLQKEKGSQPVNLFGEEGLFYSFSLCWIISQSELQSFVSIIFIVTVCVEPMLKFWFNKYISASRVISCR